MPEPTEKSFLKDVATHKMTILQDNGIYRHLRFEAATNSWNGWFDIVTWPGFLAYSGDMGCFVFARIEDMFEFFRTKPRDCPETLHINQGYWSEKLEAVDRDGRSNNAYKFSADTFRASVEEHFEEWVKDYEIPKKLAKQFREALEDEVLRFSDESEIEARQALSNFTCEIDGRKLEFSDTWEWDFDEYTYRFTWCCYALSWAIQQYDAANIELEA